MQLPRPISIDMLDFLHDGRFDCIEPGQTKEWILNNFPDPDGKCRIVSVQDLGASSYRVRRLYGR